MIHEHKNLLLLKYYCNLFSLSNICTKSCSRSQKSGDSASPLTCKPTQCCGSGMIYILDPDSVLQICRFPDSDPTHDFT